MPRICGEVVFGVSEGVQAGRSKSFADIRWTPNPGGNLYTKLGFELVETEAPNYSYYNHSCGVRRFHKFGFRKRILEKKYGLDSSLTERKMTEKLGFDRIYDCGLYKFVWKRKNP